MSMQGTHRHSRARATIDLGRLLFSHYRWPILSGAATDGDRRRGRKTLEEAMSSIAETGATPDLNKPFDQKQLIELWRYFEGAGNSAKAQMTSMATWLLTIAGGVLSYVVANSLELPALCTKSAETAILGALLGLAIGTINLVMISEFEKHTIRNWARATVCKKALPPLNHIVESSFTDTERAISEEARRSRVQSIFPAYRIITLGMMAITIVPALAHFVPAFPKC
jgi:hypothetical protein